MQFNEPVRLLLPLEATATPARARGGEHSHPDGGVNGCLLLHMPRLDPHSEQIQLRGIEHAPPLSKQSTENESIWGPLGLASLSHKSCTQEGKLHGA